MLGNIDDGDYYKPILAKESFKGNCQYYEIRGDRDIKLSLKRYLCKITLELVEKRIERKNSNKNEQKIQLSMGVNFIHTIDREKSCTFHIKSDNIEIRSGSGTNGIVTKLLESFLNKYEQEENIVKNGSSYSFKSVDIVGIHFHDIDLRRGGSYIDSPKWIKNKTATINPKNLKDNNCFQYAILAALHYQDINNNPEIISKLKPFINNYNWKNKFSCWIKQIQNI